jgi:hypothetical protein
MLEKINEQADRALSLAESLLTEVSKAKGAAATVAAAHSARARRCERLVDRLWIAATNAEWGRAEEARSALLREFEGVP